jgi:two-component system, NtrC family, response regulator AtoC
MAFRTGDSRVPAITPPPRPAFSDKGLVLVVDDLEPVRGLVASILRREGYDVETFASGEECLAALTLLMPDAIYLDLDMPGMTGLETLAAIRSKNARAPVLMLTADESVDSVVAAMKLGAYDYLAKPPSRQKLVTAAHNAIQHHRMSLQLTFLHRETGVENGYPELVTQAEVMKEVFRQMDRVAAADITLLVHGESGTGKELVARAVYRASARGDAGFVALNCAAIPESLQESELFGHEKGAFTGATERRLGKFELAHNGTLFLDEVGELSLALQAKLLRVLQDRTFQRVGGTQEIRSDFRLIAATHRDLAREVAQGTFREDLYFRIVVFELELPPLRDRTGDVELLTSHFLEDHARRSGAEISLSMEARDALLGYLWPGNVRELENAIRRALVCADTGVIGRRHFPARIQQGAQSPLVLAKALDRTATPELDRSIGSEPLSNHDETLNLEHLERRAIRKALDKTRSNVAEVSRLLGISRATLYRKLKKYALR